MHEKNEMKLNETKWIEMQWNEKNKIIEECNNIINKSMKQEQHVSIWELNMDEWVSNYV